MTLRIAIAALALLAVPATAPAQETTINIGLVRSLVTGTKMYKGFWPSDHGGIVSELRFGR